MTIQKLVDELTILCHHGMAQAEVKLMGESLVHDVTGVEKVDDNTVLIRWSEEVLRKDAPELSGEHLTKEELELYNGYYCMKNTCLGCSLYVECAELQDKIRELKAGVTG